MVIGETLPETKQIFIDTANKKNAEIFFAEEMFVTQTINFNENILACTVDEIMTCKTKIFKLGLTGLYQAKNICTVLESVEQLKNIGINISDVSLQKGLLEVKEMTGLRGRWDILQQNPTIITDVAHNKDGISQVLHQLETTYSNSNLHFVLGFVIDKDVEEVLRLFPKNARYYFTNAHIPRALPAIELAEKAALTGLVGKSFDNVNDAIVNAKANASADDVIMICGSFFVIAELENF